MYIRKVVIKNYKKFKDFSIEFNSKVNIIVGNNEEGKSTILEAIHLALSGMNDGRPIRNEISEYFFNKEVVRDYLYSLSTDSKQDLPEISIEIIFDDEISQNCALYVGDGNSLREKLSGIVYKICFNEEYASEYAQYIKSSSHTSLPIEYYKIEWKTFARETITYRSVPIKSVLIDSSAHKHQNGSDVYISKIIKDLLEDNEMVSLSQSYRTLKTNFKDDLAIKLLNERINKATHITNRNVSISVDMSMKHSWDTTLMTYIDDIPFQHIGKGEQCIIKTNLALSHKKAESSNLILLEEPENHLSHTKLNELLKQIQTQCAEKQIIISTHSNFVANKLNLSNLILLGGEEAFSFENLNKEDSLYFSKLSGYDTLRMILSKASILVEGPSDELLVQKIYYKRHGKMPIEDNIDVIAVQGLAFKRFLSIAKELSKKRIAVVTDNDGNYEEKIIKKYKDYINGGYPNIKICADSRNEFNTLEPQFVDANMQNLSNLKNIIGITGELSRDEIIKYMENNKTEWAFKVFNTQSDFDIPQYINDAINWVKDE